MKKWTVPADWKIENSNRTYWNLMTDQEKVDYQNHIAQIEDTYYEEFDTVRERLQFLVIALNDFYNTIIEVRMKDQQNEAKKLEEQK